MEYKTETVDAIATSATDSFPEMVPSISNFVELQRGLLNHTTGFWERNVEVRELNGYDEERIASFDSRKNMTYVNYITEILRMGVLSIGSINGSELDVRFEELTLGDRNNLFLSIVRATYGRERSFERPCEDCGNSNVLTIDLFDDFPLIEPSFDPTDTLKVPLKNGITHELRPPTAEDTIYVGNNASTTAEQSTLLLARCSVWRDNQPDNPEEWARSLGMSDRNKLIRELVSMDMGPRMEGVDVDCVHCGKKMTAMIDWVFLILG